MQFPRIRRWPSILAQAPLTWVSLMQSLGGSRVRLVELGGHQRHPHLGSFADLVKHGLGDAYVREGASITPVDGLWPRSLTPTSREAVDVLALFKLPSLLRARQRSTLCSVGAPASGNDRLKHRGLFAVIGPILISSYHGTRCHVLCCVSRQPICRESAARPF